MGVVFLFITLLNLLRKINTGRGLCIRLNCAKNKITIHKNNIKGRHKRLTKNNENIHATTLLFSCLCLGVST